LKLLADFNGLSCTSVIKQRR